jgi:PHD/YefM family antitoxin component YafN of YafNO toxin-antitoxin module
MSDACKKGGGPFRFISTNELRDNLSEAINRVAFARDLIVVTRRGRKIAGIVCFQDLLLLEKMKRRDASS